MIQDGVIWHIENTVVILQKRSRIKDWLAEEARQSWWGSQLLNGRDGVLISGRVLGLIKVEKILRNLIAIDLGRQDGLALWLFWLFLLIFLGSIALCCLGFRCGLGSDLCQLLLLCIIWIYFDIVDQIVSEVDCGGQVLRSLHDTIHQEADMVGSREDMDRG